MGITRVTGLAFGIFQHFPPLASRGPYILKLCKVLQRPTLVPSTLGLWFMVLGLGAYMDCHRGS